jgi:hypothetical protein
MPILTQPAFGPKAALSYITVGALIDVWVCVWYWTRETELSRTQSFWVGGLFLTGLTLLVIGFLLGPIGRAARRAELPPTEVTPAEAASNPLMVGAVGTAPVGMAPGVPMTPAVPATPATPATPAVPGTRVSPS